MRKVIIVIVILFVAPLIWGQRVIDKQWEFTLDVPSSWSEKDYMDGTDKVYEFYSADQNAGSILRVFKAPSQLTYDVLIPIFEKNILTNANRLDLKDLVSKNGIPGKQAIYEKEHNGNQLDIAVFYTLQKSKAYVLTMMVVRSIAENYREDILSITKSFHIDGISKKQSGGILAKVGDMISESKPSKTKVAVQTSDSDIAGKYMYDYSTGDNRTNFNNIYIYKNGTYEHKYQPKNSGDYIGGTSGTWKLNGNVLKLINGNISDTYTVSGNKIIRKTPSRDMVYIRQ